MFMDAELEELDAQLEEFGKDALIKHVLAELELMRAMIELVRVEIADMKRPGLNTGPGFNPSGWPPGTIYCGTVSSSSTGPQIRNGLQSAAAQNTPGVQMMQASVQQSQAQMDWDDHMAFVEKLDEIISESVAKSNKTREDLEAALAALEA